MATWPRTGIRARILETLVMLVLLALLILGIVWVASALIDKDAASMESLYGLSSSVEYNIMELEQELENVKTLKTKLERRKKASAWERNLVYPAVMVLLLIETSISVLLVACNILCLLVDETAMPKGTRGPGIGNASLSAFGFVGAALEIILIFYLMVSSVVGFYSLRFFGNFIPKKDDTTMTKVPGLGQ
ncbi:hypothetical protein GH733_016392 [Mirounga leonina]|nr:hypothetical protein GH733_016392 [Mirounga leonina]